MSSLRSRLPAVHYGLTIFLSAFLLFQVQPVIGKMILPWFGGSASVWTTCMLFFQMLLLLGYLYSHFLMRSLTPRQQSLVHIVLLASCLLFLPLAASDSWRPHGDENPTLRILALLTATIGLPYFVLSTTGPLIQAWFARERKDVVPYRLFALSNFGSLLALLAYPLAVEPWLPTRVQSLLWSLLFVCFTALCAALAWRGRNGQPLQADPGVTGLPPPRLHYLCWAALAACPSILMIADTSYLTENVAPIPLLWVLPLALYLLSFIFCFERHGWYQRRLFLPLFVLALGALAYLPTLGMNAMPLLAALGLNLLAFFIVCMVCHGELAALKPTPRYLTSYFLMLAAGGAVGGLFVGLLAPYCFNARYEYSVGIVLAGLVVAPVLLHQCRTARGRWAGGLLALAVLGALAWIRIADQLDEIDGAKLLVRDFYGTQGVYDVGTGEDAHRTLMHGQIIHGKQYTAADRMAQPTTYYTEQSGVGRTLRALASKGPLRVGLVGLGAGTLAAYGRAQDRYRIYEIDPLVVQLARTQFSFLRNNPAATDIVLGDARLTLERESPQQFDVLVIDAFSGDSVPVHLLTREAFASYFRHLKPDGVLALHVTNRFLDIPPVVQVAARSFGREARLVSTEGDRAREIYHSNWALVSADPHFFERPELLDAAQRIAAPPGFRIWTDDFSSLFAVLK